MIIVSSCRKAIYEVTVGIDNPWHQWGTKKEDILLEGEKVESGLTAKDFEGTYKVTVTDGELNVFVQATSRSKSGDDPIVNYIIVKAIPGSEADALAVLKVTVQKYLEKVAGKDYTTTTKAAFDQQLQMHRNSLMKILRTQMQLQQQRKPLRKHTAVW